MANTTNTTNTSSSLLGNILNNYFGNNNSNVAQGIANTNNYTPVNARTFLPSIGLTPVNSNVTTPTSPAPNNNLFSNTSSMLEYANRVRQWNREDTDYTVNRGREMAREAARITQPHDLNLARIQQSGSLANSNAQVQTARINADAELEKIRMENNNAIAKEERDRRNADRNRVFSMRTTVPSLTQDEHRYEMEKNNALYRNNLELARTSADAQLGVARMNNDAQLEATRTNADAQLRVARMNNEYGMQNTLLQGSQRQAELDRQGFIQLQLADIDRGQRGYDNMYSMLNQYTNRPRSNFAYWG